MDSQCKYNICPLSKIKNIFDIEIKQYLNTLEYIREVVESPTPEAVEDTFIATCQNFGIPVMRIDCRTIQSHDEICKNIKKIENLNSATL